MPKKKRFYRNIRNALIVIVSIAVTVAAVEFILARQDAAQQSGGVSYEYYLKQQAENDVLMNMSMEKALFENPFTAQLYADPNLSAADWEYISRVIDRMDDSGGAQELRDENPDLYDRVLRISQQISEPQNEYHLISYLQNDANYDDDTFNIVVIGDSFVWGQSSLNRNEIFWRLIETDLRAQGYNVRVRGAAHPGANSYEELSWLVDTDLVKELDPDLVIFGYLYNDPDYHQESYVPDDEEYAGGTNALIRAISKILPHIGERLANYVSARSMYRTDGTYVNIPSTPPILKGDVLEAFEKRFMKPLNEFAETAAFDVAIMTLPQYQGKTLQKALYAPLHTLCEKYGNVRLYDSLDDFYGSFAAPKHAANYVINCADFHPGSATHYFYAQFAEKFIKRDYADRLGAPAGADLNPKTPALNEALPGRALPTLTAQDGRSAEYTVTYPSKRADYSLLSFRFDRYYLTLPAENDFIALSFEVPAKLSEITLSSDDADGMVLYYYRINEELGYDDHTLYTATENEGVWSFDGNERVTTLMLHADCRSDDGAKIRMRVAYAD